MKQVLSIFLISCCLFVQGYAQTWKGWTNHMSYFSTTAIAEGNNYVFAIANGSLMSYGKTDESVNFYSKLTGLSDTQITHIGYNSETNSLLIVYSNGNIDIMGDQITNIPFLMNNTSIQDKTTNSLFFHKEKAYLSTNFGILVINMKKKEVTETYRLNTSVYSTTLYNNHLYAACAEKVIRGSLDDNLLDPGKWETYPLTTDQFQEKDIRRIALFDNVLCFFVEENGVYYQKTDGSIQSLLKDTNIQDMTLQNGKLIPYTTNQAYIYSSLSASDKVNTGTINGIASLKDNNTYWIAAGDESIKGIRKKGNANDYELFVSGLNTNSPKRDYAAFMSFHGQKLLVAGGGRWLDRDGKPGTLMTYENGNWFNFNEKEIGTQSGIRFSDVTCVAVDPQASDHYFASTWGEGVFEFKDNKYVKLYNHRNSALESLDPESMNYTRVEGVCFDKDNNLWMTNSGVLNGIKVLKADGNWASLYYNNLSYSDLNDKILITPSGHKWVNIPRPQAKAGIFMFDDKGTIDDTSDDVTHFVSSFTLSNGSSMSASAYYCMAQDKNGQIWIGTNIGPVYVPSPSLAITDPSRLRGVRPLRTGDDGNPAWFLDGESVRAIAVDRGNRKWIGTETSGVFVVNEDATETIANFTVDNSPLPSNYIQSIAINQQTGEVFIGTEKGIVSYMGEETTGGDTYTDVYAYPNPVRPEHSDYVTITGLIDHSNVKITDINGNLIYQTRSAGSEATWNCRNKDGNRVATGIYLVLVSSEEAGESVVTKIMVIK